MISGRKAVMAVMEVVMVMVDREALREGARRRSWKT